MAESNGVAIPRLGDPGELPGVFCVFKRSFTPEGMRAPERVFDINRPGVRIFPGIMKGSDYYAYQQQYHGYQQPQAVHDQ